MENSKKFDNAGGKIKKNKKISSLLPKKIHIPLNKVDDSRIFKRLSLFIFCFKC